MGGSPWSWAGTWSFCLGELRKKGGLAMGLIRKVVFAVAETSIFILFFGSGASLVAVLRG